MNSFAVVLLLAAAASAAYMPSAGVKRFALLGHPGAVELADIPSVYEKPTIVAVKSELEPEIVAYLAKNGLSGLAKSPETRHLHEFLMTGEDKVGVVLSKSLSAPELELPVRAVHLPEGYTLADAARTQAENSPLRVVLLHHPAEVRKSASLAKLALVGDFEVTEDSIRAAPAIHVASASPVSAKLVARLAADESAAVPSDSIIAIRANKLSSPITGIRTVPMYAKNALKQYAVEYPSKYASEYASATPVAAYPVIAGKFASAGPAAAHDGAVAYIRSTPANSARLISYPSSAAIESVAAYPSAKAASYVAIPASRAHAKPAVYESDEAAYISAIPSASGKVAISYPTGTPIEAVDVSAAVPATRHHHHLHVYESPAAAGLSSLASPSYIVA